MSSSSWQNLSVQAFVEELTSCLLPPSAQVEQDSFQLSMKWQRQTVGDFFQTVPWGLASQDLAQTEQVFGLHLTVEEGFRCFRWNAPVPLSPEQEESEAVEPSFSSNLENFANLF